MFKDSVTIGRIVGIPIRLHISFLLILPFLAWTFGRNISIMAEIVNLPFEAVGGTAYILGFLLAVSLFLSVGLHELAHSLVAMKKDVKIHSINLMLFGGVAQMDEIPENPSHEAMIAFAGPFFSFLFGLLLMGLGLILGAIQVSPEVQFLLTYLGYMNFFLAFFNLVPAFPTDGGRLFRAFLARRTSFLQATRIASQLGKGIAFLLGILGLLSGNFILLFIAFFIYIGANQEYQSTLLKTTLEGFTVQDLMSREVATVQQGISIDALIQKMLMERHGGYPVVDEQGTVVGCVTMEDVQKVAREEHGQKEVQDIMSREIKRVRPDDEIYQALKTMSREDVGRLMVMEGEELMGIITRSDIMKGYRLRQIREE